MGLSVCTIIALPHVMAHLLCSDRGQTDSASPGNLGAWALICCEVLSVTSAPNRPGAAGPVFRITEWLLHTPTAVCVFALLSSSNSSKPHCGDTALYCSWALRVTLTRVLSVGLHDCDPGAVT